ncbi:MAG: 2-dehydropantoate 2-reductase [Burkholderiales bacterium]|nr:2-dehydropantoate 2-reductase [Burkholderiales bacterium]
MSKRIAVVGAGALGGYVGGYLAHSGHDVTLIDMWPENIEAIRARGLELDGLSAEEKITVKNARTMHLTEVQSLAKGKPIDIACVAVKSYDTEWATMLIKPYLAPGGFVVSLQNCLNEEKIAAIVGWGKTLGVIASVISVELYEPGRIRRMAPKGGAQHTVFRVGEVHGIVTPRVEELVAMLSAVDSSKPTTNLWGERWSKLCLNGMGNGVAAATGLSGKERDTNETIRRFSIKLGGEAVRVGQALGFQLVSLRKMDPQRLALAAEGHADALAEVEQIIQARSAANPRAGIQRPSMAQDMRKGRRTEIQLMNGYIAEKGKLVGIPTPAHEKITELVTRVERGELKPSAALLEG